MIILTRRLHQRTPTYSLALKTRFKWKTNISWTTTAILIWVGFPLEPKDVPSKWHPEKMRSWLSSVMWLTQANISENILIHQPGNCHYVFLGPNDLKLYSVVDLKSCVQPTPGSNITNILVEVFLSKPLTGNLLTQFLPTALLLIIRKKNLFSYFIQT